MAIKDSGTRMEFRTGAVRDIQKGKGRCDLMPIDVLADIYLYQFRDEIIHFVLKGIHRFQETGNVEFLYDALDAFTGETPYSEMFLDVSIHFEEGADKYGERNWEKGLPVACYINSAVRHYLKFLRGDDDERHDRAFVWNMLCACWTTEHRPELCEYGERRCPCCDEILPPGYKDCPNCRVHVSDYE